MSATHEHEIETTVQRPGEPGCVAIRCLALLHGAACIGRFDVVATLATLARRLGIPAPRVHEAALQVAAYGGYPRAIEALAALAAPGEAAEAADTESTGDEPPQDPALRAEAAAAADGEARAIRGRLAFEAVYGEQAAPVRAALERLSPGLARQVVEDAYGRVLARPGLAMQERELLAVAALALMALPSPLDSHVRGALRNGSTPPAVIDILDSCRILASEEALSVIARVRARLHRTQPEP